MIKNENVLRKWFLVIVLLMSATLLYGGYQVHQEATRKSKYEDAVRKRADQINAQIVRELDGAGGETTSPKDSINFLRVCAEGQ